MRFQLNFGTSHPLTPFLEGGGRSAPPRVNLEPKTLGWIGLNNVQLKIEDEKMVRRPNLEEVAIFKLGQGPMNFSFNIINNKNSKYMFTYSQQFTPKFNFYS